MIKLKEQKPDPVVDPVVHETFRPRYGAGPLLCVAHPSLPVLGDRCRVKREAGEFFVAMNTVLNKFLE